MDRYQLTIACVYLGCKLQNWFLPVEEAVKEYYNIKNTQQPNSSINNKIDLVKYEIEILNLLGFEIDIETPYAILEKFSLLKKIEPNIEKLAYNIINDSYRRPLCVYFPSTVITLSCLYISFKTVKDDFNFEELRIFDDNLREEEILTCVDHILKLYEGRIKLN